MELDPELTQESVLAIVSGLIGPSRVAKKAIRFVVRFTETREGTPSGTDGRADWRIRAFERVGSGDELAFRLSAKDTDLVAASQEDIHQI